MLEWQKKALRRAGLAESLDAVIGQRFIAVFQATLGHLRAEYLIEAVGASFLPGVGPSGGWVYLKFVSSDRSHKSLPFEWVICESDGEPASTSFRFYGCFCDAQCECDAEDGYEEHFAELRPL